MTAKRPGKQAGLVVAALTSADAVDLFAVLGELEGLAAAEAARSAPDVHQHLLEELSAIQLTLEQAASTAAGSATDFLDLDRQFHQAILGAGARPGRPRLEALHASLRPQLDRYSLLYAGHIPGHLPVVVDEHADIVSALRCRDAERARVTVRANWQCGADRMVEAINKLGALGDWSAAIWQDDS